jgi:hypothetical protein
MVGEPEDAYAEPEADEEHDVDEDEESTVAPVVWFCAPVGRVMLFTLVGGWFYHAYWSYRCWSAYRSSQGYSQRARWQQIEAATRFRPSAFWRAVLAVLYDYLLLFAVRHEARRARVGTFIVPVLGFAMQLFASYQVVWLHNLLLALAFAPAQSTINSLGAGTKPQPVRSGEWLCLGIGALSTCLALASELWWTWRL